MCTPHWASLGPVCIGIAVFISIILSFIHLVTCVRYSIIFDCNIKEQSSAFLVYATYFYDKKTCAELSNKQLFPEEYNVSKKIEFPTRAKWASTLTMAIQVYSIIDMVWIFWSTILLVCIICRAKKTCAAVFYMPWVLIGLATVAFDIVGIVIFSIHISNIKIAEDWLKLIGVENPDKYELDDIPRSIFIYASVDMLLKSVRYIIFFIVNIFLILVVGRAGLDAFTKHKERQTLDVQLHLNN